MANGNGQPKCKICGNVRFKNLGKLYSSRGRFQCQGCLNVRIV